MLVFVLMISKADCDAETGSVEEETGMGEGKGFSRCTQSWSTSSFLFSPRVWGEVHDIEQCLFKGRCHCAAHSPVRDDTPITVVNECTQNQKLSVEFGYYSSNTTKKLAPVMLRTHKSYFFNLILFDCKFYFSFLLQFDLSLQDQWTSRNRC